MKENSESENEIKKDTDYLVPLFDNIENAYINQTVMTFRIVEPKTNGFVIKIGGLFAFIPFNNFGWSYRSLEIWSNVSKSLVGAYFKGKISTYNKERPSIFVDAQEQKFQIPHLEIGKSYDCVISNKKDYGVFVDLGVHYNWRCGSILGLIHESSFAKPYKTDEWIEGEITSVLFHGYDEKERLILGEIYSRPIPIQERVEPLLGTIQLVNVKVGENGRYSFSLFDKYLVGMPILKAIYPKTRRVIRSYLKELKDGDQVYCELLEMNMKKRKFIARLYISEVE